MVDVVFTIVAESVFSYALEHFGLADKVRDWLGRHPAKLAFQKALASAFTAFTRHYPEHAESFFDRTFLADRAAPILAQLLTRTGRPDPTALLNAWHASLTPLPLPAARRGEMLQASSDFLRWFEAELMQADALQALFDSRALDALNQRVESLTEELRRVLAVTTTLAQSQPVGTPAEPGERAAAMGRDRIIQRSFATGDFARLQDLYIPPDDVYERVQVQDFVGRDWLKARVEAFLHDPKRTSGVLIIEGEAGVGKTAFLARLVFERGYLHVFAGQERARGNTNVASAILSLEAQLVTRYRLVEYLDRNAISDRHANPTSLGVFMRQAAAQCAAGERIIIVCDALDEAGVYPQGNVLGLPEVLPDGIFLILSRRPSPPVRLHFADLTPVVEHLQAASAENQKDLGAYLRAVAQRPVILDQLAAQGYTREQFVHAIQNRSGGVWMYVHYVVDEVQRGERIPLGLDRLPLGLIGFYAEYWERYRADVETWYDISLPLLTTLAAVQTPLTFQRWVALAGVSGNQSKLRRDVDDRWRAFISRDGDSYQIYHASLRDFLTGNVERLGETSDLIAEMAEATRAAHGRIVADFRRQSDGDWPRLASDDYARRYLCEHLVGAGEIATLWKITTESNAWAEARNRIEDNYAGFLGDLRRAWDAAESETDWDLARQIRCALINSSIAALANNLTPDLALALVETKTWSLGKVLAHISCMTDDPRRSGSLAALGPVLTEPWWGEALRIANAIGDRGLRTRTLVTLAPRLPEHWRIEALSDLIPAQPDIEQDWQQAELLATLAPVLPADLHGAAVAAAGGLYHNLSRFAALTALVPTLDEAPKARALAQALEESALIGIPARRVQALVGLAPHLTPEQQHRALTEALETIGRETLPAIRADLLVRYGAELVREQPQRVLDLIRAIPESPQRLRALAALLPTLSGADQILALSVATPLEDDEACHQGIVALSAVLPSHLWAVALERALAIRVPEARAQALTSLSRVLTNPDRQSAIAEALASIAQMSDDALRAAQLRALVPLLTEPQRAAAWTLAGSLRQAAQRALILGELAAGTEGDQRSTRLEDALIATHDITDPAGRLGVLSVWAATLAPEEQDPAQTAALKALKAIAPLAIRATAALDLAAWLSPSRCRDLAEVLLSLPTEVDAAPRLKGLLPHLAVEDRALVVGAAVAAMGRLPDSSARVRGVIGLAPWLVGDSRQTILDTTLQEASNHPDAMARADLLLALAPVLSEPQRAVALAVVSAIEDPGLRAKTLVRLAPHLAGATQTVAYTRALAAPQELPRLSTRIQALFDIARNGSGESARQALRQALLSAREIGDGVPVVDLLVAALGHLPPQGQAAARESAVQAARSVHDPREKLHSLLGLEPHLPEPLKVEAMEAALEVARSYSYRPAYVETVTEILPHLPVGPFRETAVDEARIQIRGLVDAQWRARRVLELRPFMTEPQWADAQAEVVEELRRAEWPSGQVDILEQLAPHLSIEHAGVLFAVARRLRDPEDRVRAWIALHACVDHAEWTLRQPEILAAMSEIPPYTDLARLLGDLVGLLDDAYRSSLVPLALRASDPRRRVEALLAIVPGLAETDRDAARVGVESQAECTDEPIPWGKLLGSVVPKWPAADRAWALRIIQKVEPLPARIEAMTAVLPYLTLDQATEARHAIQEAITGLADGDDQLEALRLFAPVAAEGDRDAVIRDAIRLAQTQASEWGRVAVIAELAPLLSAEQCALAVEVLRNLEDVSLGLPALQTLLPILDQTLREPLVVDTLRRIQDETPDWRRQEALEIVAPYVSPASQAMAITLAESLSDSRHRVEALLHLACALPGGQRSSLIRRALRLTLDATEPLTSLIELINVACDTPCLSFALRRSGSGPSTAGENRTFADEQVAIMRFLAADLAAAWDSSDWERALKAASPGGPAVSDVGADQKLSRLLPVNPAVTAHWRDRLHLYASRHRGHLLADLRAILPWLLSAGGNDLAQSIVSAVIDVRTWWS